MRIILGFCSFHGGQKLFGWFGNSSRPAYHCRALHQIGLFTSYAAFIASGEMAIAYFMGHFSEKFLAT
jgi:putative oxidoreductase